MHSVKHLLWLFIFLYKQKENSRATCKKLFNILINFFCYCLFCSLSGWFVGKYLADYLTISRRDMGQVRSVDIFLLGPTWLSGQLATRVPMM